MQLECCTWREGRHKGLASKDGAAETACGVFEAFALRGVEDILSWGGSLEYLRNRREVYYRVCIFELLRFTIQYTRLRYFEQKRGEKLEIDDLPISGWHLMSSRPALRPLLLAANRFSHSLSSRRSAWV